MTDKNTEMDKEQVFDPLDMNNYKLEKLPKMEKTSFEKWMARLGGPLAILSFILIFWVFKIPFLENLNVDSLPEKAANNFAKIGAAEFIRANYAMLAIFAASIILWITESIPNYLTSLLVILGLVLTGVTSQKEAFAQLGHPVMWLNILSFILEYEITSEIVPVPVGCSIYGSDRHEYRKQDGCLDGSRGNEG